MSDVEAIATVPTEADLREIAEQVWASYLDPEGVNPLLTADPAKTRIDVLSSVSITGTWHGHIIFGCTEKAARNAAAAFLMMDADEVAVEDVADVLGELANIVGGNVKSMLPAGCFVSLPHVVMSPGAVSHWPGVVQIANMVGEWLGESVTVSMWQGANEVDDAVKAAMAGAAKAAAVAVGTPAAKDPAADGSAVAAGGGPQQSGSRGSQDREVEG